MKETAKEINDILQDYHIDRGNGFKMSTERVLNWVSQFDEPDREFILSEYLYLLNQGIYVSRDKAKTLLRKEIEIMSKKYGYADCISYLSETVFLDVQNKGKSQGVLLQLLNEVISTDYGKDLAFCGTMSQKNFIYLDDVMATGQTVLNGTIKFFSDKALFEDIKKGKKTFTIIVFCKHTWAESNLRFNLKLHFSDDWFTRSLQILCHYKVENNLYDLSPTLNVAYPIIDCSPKAKVFLQNLEANKYENMAFRPKHLPKVESFYSNPDNRKRFESIILEKGLEILSKVKNLKSNQRPLGNTYPKYKTLGTGTLFFTWNNISNTSPIVFWWDNAAHDWSGLFPLHNRGQN